MPILNGVVVCGGIIVVLLWWSCCGGMCSHMCLWWSCSALCIPFVVAVVYSLAYVFAVANSVVTYVCLWKLSSNHKKRSLLMSKGEQMSIFVCVVVISLVVCVFVKIVFKPLKTVTAYE